jgi:hypothetical protein
MGYTRLLLCFLTAVCYQTQAASDCGSLVQEYYEFNRQQLTPYGADFLYLLRTPNTYSRELEACMIRPAVVGTQRCPSFNEQIDKNALSKLKGCSVLSSSDDLSVLQSVSGSTAVAAQLRDPVDRLISAYELAVEVAVQKSDSAKSKNPFEAMQKQHPNDVWPWSMFSAFLSKDLLQRVRGSSCRTAWPWEGGVPNSSTVQHNHRTCSALDRSGILHSGLSLQLTHSHNSGDGAV